MNDPRASRLRRRRVLRPLDWALTGPARSLRKDLQELVLFPVVRLFARMKVEGRGNLAAIRGPVVLVSNHASHVDAPVLLAALPHRIRHRTVVAAAADYFYKVAALGALTSLWIGTIPFQRDAGSRESLESCKEAIRRGWSVLMFPEGTRSATGEMGRFRRGAAFLCIDMKCAALPIHLSGTHEVMPRGASFPKRREVRVRFGPMLGPSSGDDYESFNARLEAAVTALGDS